MRLREKDVQISGDLEGEKVNMSVDERSLSKLMGILSDIYSDVIVAVVREYSTNAIDAHIESDNYNPIEITTPTALRPNLVIKDYGIGMDADDIRNTYSKYGASTKTDSDDFNGQMGIGAKSALAYGGKTFTVIGVKNGIKTSVIVGYDPEAGGTMEIVDESDTTDPNGVTITVPVNNRFEHDKFEQAAKDFQKYAQFRVKVNGREVTPVGTWQTDKIRLIPRDRYSYGGRHNDYVVMGNVAYRIMNDGQPSRLDMDSQVAFYVDMGEVDFTPSREDLAYTSRTKATIEKYYKEFIANKVSNHQKQIDACSSHTQAFLKRRHIINEYSHNLKQYAEFTYKGTPVPKETSLRGTKIFLSSRPAPKLWDFDRSKDIKIEPYSSNKIVLLNYTNKIFSKIHASKVEKYCLDNKIDFQNQIDVVDSGYETDDLKWFDDHQILDWDLVKPTKVIMPDAGKKKQAEKAWEGTGGEAEGKLYHFVPDRTKNIWYTSKSSFGSGRYFDDRAFMSEGTDNDQVFLVIESQEDKFKKLYPNAESIDNLRVSRVEEYLKNLSAGDQVALGRYAEYDRITLSVDVSKILDPQLRDCVVGSSAEKVYSEYAKYRKIASRISDYSLRNTCLGKMPGVGTLASNVRDKYPLIPRYSSGHKATDEQVLIYVNAVYKELYENKGV